MIADKNLTFNKTILVNFLKRVIKARFVLAVVLTTSLMNGCKSEHTEVQTIPEVELGDGLLTCSKLQNEVGKLTSELRSMGVTLTNIQKMDAILQGGSTATQEVTKTEKNEKGVIASRAVSQVLLSGSTNAQTNVERNISAIYVRRAILIERFENRCVPIIEAKDAEQLEAEGKRECFVFNGKMYCE